MVLASALKSCLNKAEKIVNFIFLRGQNKLKLLFNVLSPVFDCFILELFDTSKKMHWIWHLISPNIIGSGTSTSTKQATALDFNKEAVEAVANANNNFGNVLFKILAKPEQNLIMSSYSVSSVLNMILNGAKGSTASQLKQGLKVKNFDVVKNGFKDALTLMKSNENYTLKAANRYVN